MKELTTDEKKKIVNDYKKYCKRAYFNGYLYLAILKNSLNEYINCNEESKELYKGVEIKELISDYSELKNKIKHNEIIAIICAAMFLECLIWDYSAVNVSQTFTKDALGKMNLLAKWKVVPKLVNNNKKITINSNAIHLLGNLVKERNSIVHSKSKAIPDDYEKFMKYIDTLSQGRSFTANEAYQCVIDCTDELKKVDTTDYWFFQDNAWDSYKKA